MKAYTLQSLYLILLLLISCRQQVVAQPQVDTIRHDPQPVNYIVQEDSLEIILSESSRIIKGLESAYSTGYEEGYRNSYSTHKREILDSSPDKYKDQNQRKRYLDGYRKGMEEGYQAYLVYLDSVTKARTVKPEKSSVP